MSQIECDVIVFDFDGVLVDYNLRPRPLGVSLLKEAVKGGLVVYIVSGRLKDELYTVKNALKDMDIKTNKLKDILLRPSSRLSEKNWKLMAYSRIIDKEGCIAEVHEDNPYVLSSIRKLGIETLVLHVYEGSERCEVLKGKPRLFACINT